MARVNTSRRKSVDVRAKILAEALVDNSRTYDDLTRVEQELLGAWLSENHGSDLLKIEPEKRKTRRRRSK